MSFALGQRWISDTETDLGLGTVVAIEGRMITLLFPANGEQRLYARENAPVTRVSFNVGDRITSHDEWQLDVRAIEETDGLLIYHGTRVDNGAEETLREVMLSNFIKFNKPQDRLFAGQIDRYSRFALRYEALTHQHARRTNPTRGLASGRVSLIPHQLYIAQEVGHRHAPRVLLADEVGLGKTIEAGMIIQQQLLSGRAQRVLILVPESLQYQWLIEMLRRFNLTFSLFDEDRCIDTDMDAMNPFDSEQLIICSLNWLRKKKARFEQVMDCEWDLLVVDEAHHLVWDEETPSREYQIVESLAEITAGVLLLTATPDQLGHQSHFARLRLLDPERFYDYDAFLAEEQTYGEIAKAAEPLMNGEALTDEQIARLTALLPNFDQAQFAEPAYRDTVLHELLDRHGTGRILFRNTRAASKGFPIRHLHEYPMPLPAQYKTAIRVSSMMGNAQGDALTKAKRYLYPEKIFAQFEGDHASWTAFDPRVSWMLELIKSNRYEKFLVICSEASTALTLEDALRTREGIRCAVFHEGMSLLERDKSAAYFADPDTGAQVMLCSEIGSEGRNFQFAHHLVLFDLPLNPDLLEQRIGRLDRIGQLNEVEIHVPYLDETPQKALMRWYHEGLDAFEHTCPTGRAVYDEVQDDLLEMLAEKETVDTQLQALLDRTTALHQTLKQKLEQGRDRLLELHSSGGQQALQLVERLEEEDDETALVSFALHLFDDIGISQDDRGEQALVLRPTEHMLIPSFPGLPEDGVTITFERDVALSREDLTFLTWDHPMIRGGVDLILASDIGSTAVALLKNSKMPAGTIFLELVFVAESVSHPQLYRFMPPTPIRLLLDKNGNNVGDQVGFDQFHRQLIPINRQLASKLVSASQSVIHDLIGVAEPIARPRMETIVQNARATMQKTLQAELSRLEQLKAVNPSVRNTEITFVQDLQNELNHLLDQTQLKLDAVRFVVVTNQ
jgi:ATP-dependent helicase HepA